MFLIKKYYHSVKDINLITLWMFFMNTKLTKLKLNNVGGFKDFEINFHKRLTVLIGKNGSGKTTILSSIAAMFDLTLEALLKTTLHNGVTADESIRNSLLTIYKNRSLLFGQMEDLYIGIYFKLNNQPKTLEMMGEKDLNYAELANGLLDLYRKGISLPIFIYYSTYNIPLNDVSFSDLEQDKHPLSFYIAACQEESFDFNRFFNWFRWQENLNKEVGSKQYNIIREVVIDVLNSDTESHATYQYSNLHITWQKKYNGDLCIEKEGVSLDMNQLSAGEKMLLILVADLSRRLVLANPKSDNPLQGEGVVLIDEIDLHLHPSWQRGIIPKLTKIFPNCQFIVSTHSPLILSDVKPENIVILEDFKALQNTQHSQGRDSNSILSDIMDDSARPRVVQDQLDQCFELIDQEKFKKAKKSLKYLEEHLGSNDPDIVYIHSLLEFYA
jgi:predicted ATP-binding protein involved in virulence